MANDLPRIASTGTFNTGQSKAPEAPSVKHKEEKPPRELPHIDSQHLVDTFITAAQIWSPSGHEKEMAEKMKADFEALHIPGSTVEIDDSAPRTGSDTGNVIVGIPASDHASKDAKSIALSFHLDRVPVRMPGVPEDEPAGSRS